MLPMLLACAVASAAPRALLLAEAPLFRDPDLTPPASARLSESTVVEALAIGTTPLRSEGRSWLGVPPVLVRVGDTTGWVHGDLLAIEQDSDGPGAWTGERVPTRDLGPVRVWSAARTAREWSDKEKTWDRWVHEGWVVVEETGAVFPVPWMEANGWGSSRYAEQVVWRDVTGDGVDDALVVVRETVTEVGNAGATLELWDFTRGATARLARVPVQDPLGNGLATERTFARLEVAVDARPLTVRKVGLVLVDTPGRDLPMLQRLEQHWQWTGEALQARPPALSTVEAILAPAFLDAYRTFWMEAHGGTVGEMRRIEVLLGW